MHHFISDTHFGHANVLRFDERPFASIEDGFSEDALKAVESLELRHSCRNQLRA